MKKAIIILALAAAFYWWQHQPTVKPAAETTVTAPAVRSIVIVPASQGGLDGKGGWEFKSNVKSGENAQTDLTMKRNW